MNKEVYKPVGKAGAAHNSKQGTIPNSFDDFPFTGNVRPAPTAKFLAIGLSSLWLFVRQGRIAPPLKFSARVSVFDAEYIRELAKNGIPSLEEIESKGDANG